VYKYYYFISVLLLKIKTLLPSITLYIMVSTVVVMAIIFILISLLGIYSWLNSWIMKQTRITHFR